MAIETNVSDAEIELAFTNTNFGDIEQRKYLELTVLKAAMGFRCGYTITTIMNELKLIKKNGSPSEKGLRFIRHAFAGSDLLKGGG